MARCAARSRRRRARWATADRVISVGTVERDRIAKHVAAFDIALQPDVTEYASPLKLFEYMALKRAIIAPDRENIREVLTHGHDALLFDPGSEDSLVQGLRALAESAEPRRRLGEAARRMIDERGFTCSTMRGACSSCSSRCSLSVPAGTRAASAAGSAGKA
ncbi:MAG: glycosyltransferase [Planctomycetota bacterium]